LERKDQYRRCRSRLGATRQLVQLTPLSVHVQKANPGAANARPNLSYQSVLVQWRAFPALLPPAPSCLCRAGRTEFRMPLIMEYVKRPDDRAGSAIMASSDSSRRHMHQLDPAGRDVSLGPACRDWRGAAATPTDERLGRTLRATAKVLRVLCIVNPVTKRDCCFRTVAEPRNLAIVALHSAKTVRLVKKWGPMG
jgi:hypothetical protein